MIYKKLFIRTAAVVTALATPVAALAVNPFTKATTYVSDVASGAEVSGATTPLPTIVGRIINIALGFLGILLLAYILFAGYLWMTAGGEEKKVDQAKDMIKNAIIGLVIIVAAFAISNFVLARLVEVVR